MAWTKSRSDIYLAPILKYIPWPPPPVGSTKDSTSARSCVGFALAGAESHRSKQKIMWILQRVWECIASAARNLKIAPHIVYFTFQFRQSNWFSRTVSFCVSGEQRAYEENSGMLFDMTGWMVAQRMVLKIQFFGHADLDSFYKSHTIQCSSNPWWEDSHIQGVYLTSLTHRHIQYVVRDVLMNILFVTFKMHLSEWFALSGASW